MAVNTYKQDERVSDVSNMKTLLRTVSYLKDYKLQTALAIIMILAQTLIVAILPSFDCPPDGTMNLASIPLTEETKTLPTVLAWNGGNKNPALLLWKEELRGFLEGKKSE